MPARRTALRIRTSRCRSTASANNVSTASTQVPTRMLNGGISSSAIFIAGQVRPQARLTPTSMSRAVASTVTCEGELGTQRFRQVQAGQRAG